MELNLEERELQKKSSAVTLSDMEMFIFPELIYSLMLANIMSPILWTWREDPWFEGIGRKSMSARMSRLRQFIMDRYTFNLDLETWGLTRQADELERFKEFVDRDMLAKSNALFGYEGDKYYFDIDIRRHFGLDKYEGDVIPYWKTETLEAMTAFAHKPGYVTGAGECVSLAALYGAALFVVLGLPLDKIYMMATPLHSQNFIDVSDGIITNNRRIVTRNMWYNGTELSAQARRALENERVTLVAHESGTIHTFYKEATIAKNAYENFAGKLRAYLSTTLTPEILGNFLRQAPDCHRCFVIRKEINGVRMYIPLARAFAYERDLPYKVTGETRGKLLDNIEQSEFVAEKCVCCLVLDDIEDYLRKNTIDVRNPAHVEQLREHFVTSCMDSDDAVRRIVNFCHVEPQLPDSATKEFVVGKNTPLGITPDMTREQIIARVAESRETNEYCRMAFYAWRDLSRTEAAPFLVAARDRNPVCIAETAEKYADETALVAHVQSLPNTSIYAEEFRIAQPDEVWNFAMGDGLERALMLAVILRARGRVSGDVNFVVKSERGKAVLSRADGHIVCELPSEKIVREKIWTV